MTRQHLRCYVLQLIDRLRAFTFGVQATGKAETRMYPSWKSLAMVNLMVSAGYRKTYTITGENTQYLAVLHLAALPVQYTHDAQDDAGHKTSCRTNALVHRNLTA